jgi:hypothetical protein
METFPATYEIFDHLYLFQNLKKNARYRPYMVDYSLLIKVVLVGTSSIYLVYFYFYY